MKKTSIIGLGTAAIGRPQYINIRNKSNDKPFSLLAFRKQGTAMLDEAYTKGIRYFDTAPGYGMAEQLLIDWVKGKQDPKIEVATKWGYTYVANFDKAATTHEVKEHSLAKLNEQWSQSKNLLPKLSTYQIHSATLETGVLKNEAVLEQLANLKKEHHLKIGLSTTGSNQVEVLKMANDVEVGKEQLFDAFQVTYNIFDQSTAQVIEQLHHQNKRVIIKEALANGRVFSNKNYSNYADAYTVLTQLSKKYGVGVDAIALRFCTDNIPVFKVLSGASIKEHMEDNLMANDFSLEEKDLEELRGLKVEPINYWTERKELGWN